MAATSFCSSLLPSLSSSSSLIHNSSKTRFCCSKRSSGRVFAKEGRPHGSEYYRGRLVDESLIILRKRIHEMTVMERNYEPPAEWMEWEKQHFVQYDEFVCQVVGLLQMQLMNTRPSFALGMLMLVSVSVPISAGTIVSHLMEAANGVLSSVQHLG